MAKPQIILASGPSCWPGAPIFELCQLLLHSELNQPCSGLFHPHENFIKRHPTKRPPGQVSPGRHGCKFKLVIFSLIKDRYLEHFLLNCPKVNAITLKWLSTLIQIMNTGGLFSQCTYAILGQDEMKVNLLYSSCEIPVGWMPHNLSDVTSTLVQIMTATSHYLSQCWPRSMLPYGITSHNDLTYREMADVMKTTFSDIFPLKDFRYSNFTKVCSYVSNRQYVNCFK